MKAKRRGGRGEGRVALGSRNEPGGQAREPVPQGVIRTEKVLEKRAVRVPPAGYIPPPDQCRPVREALAAAGRMTLRRVIVLGETDEGFVAFSSESGDRMDAKTMLWLLEQAERLLLGI